MGASLKCPKCEELLEFTRAGAACLNRRCDFFVPLGADKVDGMSKEELIKRSDAYRKEVEAEKARMLAMIAH